MIKDRICLRCEGIFKSPGPHIRKCGNCLRDDTQAEYYDQNLKDWSLPEIEYDIRKSHNKNKRTRARLDG